jgi:hypothetical protein
VVLQLGGWARCYQLLSVKKKLRNIRKLGCFLWRQNNLDVNYSPTRFSGGSVSRGCITHQKEKGRTDLPLGTLNVRNLHRAFSLAAAARKLARYKLHLFGVRKVRWDKEGTVKAGDYSFFYGKEIRIISWEQGFCTSQNSVNS